MRRKKLVTGTYLGHVAGGPIRARHEVTLPELTNHSAVSPPIITPRPTIHHPDMGRAAENSSVSELEMSTNLLALSQLRIYQIEKLNSESGRKIGTFVREDHN